MKNKNKQSTLSTEDEAFLMSASDRLSNYANAIKNNRNADLEVRNFF